jgi:hypothetical protein
MHWLAIAVLVVVLAWLLVLARMQRSEEIERAPDGPNLEARSRMVEKLNERIQKRKASGRRGRI